MEFLKNILGVADIEINKNSVFIKGKKIGELEKLTKNRYGFSFSFEEIRNVEDVAFFYDENDKERFEKELIIENREMLISMSMERHGNYFFLLGEVKDKRELKERIVIFINKLLDVVWNNIENKKKYYESMLLIAEVLVAGRIEDGTGYVGTKYLDILYDRYTDRVILLEKIEVEDDYGEMEVAELHEIGYIPFEMFRILMEERSDKDDK